MLSLIVIAWRNLMRFGRRTLLTAGLIAIGVLAVLLFVALSGSFKNLMIGQFTDSVMGDLEIHHKGYVASLDNLPLNLNLTPAQWQRARAVLAADKTVAAYAPVVKFGGLFSNFTESTNVRVNGIDPAREAAVLPLLPGRVAPADAAGLLKPGQILVPQLLANGMKVKVGDTVVVVTTNRDGSVNGRTFTVRGIVSDLSGPGGRDAYIDIDDARHILRLATPEVSEVLVRLKSLETLHATVAALRSALDGGPGKPAFEVHGWDDLSPFAHIARLIDLLTLFVKVILVSIALISIMNVMIMAVYERIREIGTIAAIGTPPGRILGLFLIEGLLLGVIGAAVGIALSLGAVAVLHVHKVSFAFGMGNGTVILSPSLRVSDIVTVGVVVIVVAVLASLQPAWKAARMDPISALRHI